MQKLVSCLAFNENALEAVELYVSVIKNSKINEVKHYPENGPMSPGKVMTVSFSLDGQQLLALNGGPSFRFGEGGMEHISLIINCDDQEQIDRIWDAFCDGGRPLQCGWVIDRFGIAWQVIPSMFTQLMESGDADKSLRAMKVIWTMDKIIIKDIEEALHS